MSTHVAKKYDLTVGSLLKELRRFDRDTVVTFGSSQWTARPLIFYRFKRRGAESIQMELNELFEFGSGPEHESRITVGRIVDGLEGMPEHWELFFGCTVDAAPLKLEKIVHSVAFDLTQPDTPPYVVDGIEPSDGVPIEYIDLKERNSR